MAPLALAAVRYLGPLVSKTLAGVFWTRGVRATVRVLTNPH